MSSDNSTLVSIVDDHPLYRVSLKMIIESDPEIGLGVSAGSVKEFFAHEPAAGGVVLLDFSMPGVFGAEAARQIGRAGHRVLMLSASEKPEHVLATLDAGACGYVSKSADAAQVLWAVRRVAEGSFYVAPHLAAILLERRRKAHPTVAVQSLTQRQRDVLALVAEGLTDQEVADQLRIGVRTVRSHLDHIRVKTGRRRRAELTRLAVDEGIVQVQ